MITLRLGNTSTTTVDPTNPDASQYSGLDDAACALIPACAILRKGGTGTGSGGVVDDIGAQAGQAAAQAAGPEIQARISAALNPALQELTSFKKTVAWSTVGLGVIVLGATGIWAYVRLKERRR